MKKKESKGPEFSKDGHVRPLLIWVFEIAVVLVLAAVVSIFFCQTIVMQEGGMEPTLATGDKVLINKVSYKLGEPERGDIVAFKKDAKQHSSMHVKRIIGLPGETVQIKDGLILINGETYMEKKDFPKISNPGLAETQITLGKNEYFVLGDNRNNSEDSRFAEIGPVTSDRIEGKVWYVISPSEHRGFVS